MRKATETAPERTATALVLLISGLLIALPASGRAAPTAASTPTARPRIGLALSGGGARGAAHIGVLKILEERRVPIDFIAGTSMGAIVGGLYASGMSPAELEKLISQIDWIAAFDDQIPRRDRSFRRKRDDDLYLVRHKPGISGTSLRFPPSFIDGQKIDLLLKRYTLPAYRERDFDDLPIPFRAVAADLATGNPVVIGEGDLALAIRASMSIPIVFAPRELESELLADGGIARNLPIDVVRSMGADVVIAVDISTPLREREELTSILAIADQLSGILTRRDTDAQIASLESTDVFIRPQLGDITTASFDRAAEAIPAGTEAAEAAGDRLDRLSVSIEEYAGYQAKRRVPRHPPAIDAIRVVNHSRLSNAVISSHLHVRGGEPLDVGRLERDVEQIFGLELFESVYYDVAVEGNRTVLTITARERSWGPNYLQFGSAVYEDFEGPNFNLAAAYTRTAVDRLNGEWRTGIQFGQEPGVFTELYQPLDNGLRFFAHIRTSVDEQSDNVFDPRGRKVAELGVLTYGVQCALGRELGTWGEIRAGVLREAGAIKLQVGEPGVPELDFDAGEVFAQFHVDEQDDAYFPRSGGTARLRLSAGLAGLGSDVEYEQGYFEGAYAVSAGRWTATLGGSVGMTLDDNAPYRNLFRLGGFGRLSGLEQEELLGQQSAFLSLQVYRRVADFGVATFYAGASAEYGNTFESRNDIGIENFVTAGSLFLGLESMLGPACVGYGLAEGDRGNYYFFLGKKL